MTVESATEVVSDIWTPVEEPATVIAADALRRRKRRRWIPAAAVSIAVAVTAAVLLIVLWPGGLLEALSKGDSPPARDLPKNGYNLHVQIDSLYRAGKTVTLEWSVKYVSTTNSNAAWEPGSESRANYSPTTNGVILIDPATGSRHPTAEQSGCLCSNLTDKRWRSGETASFYNAFTDLPSTAEKVSVDIPGVGLFAGVPIDNRE